METDPVLGHLNHENRCLMSDPYHTSHTHFLSICLPLSLYLSLTDTHTLCLSHTHAHTHTHTHTPTHTPRHTPTHTHTPKDPGFSYITVHSTYFDKIYSSSMHT